MDEYPNEDEEYELMYADELELLNEQEDFGDIISRPVRKTLQLDTASTSKINQNKPTNVPNTVSKLNNSLETNLLPLGNIPSVSQIASADIIASQQSNATEDATAKKRSIQELFGDIDDILEEGNVGYVRAPKKQKTDRDTADLALIEHIIQLRKLAKEHNNHDALFGKNYTTTRADFGRHNLSYRVPKFPFIGVTRHDGERVYVRFHSEEYEKEQTRVTAEKCSFAGVMGNAFKEIWNEATIIINKELENTQDDSQSTETTILQTEVDENKSLWVETYKPRKYLELLSDESTNRTLLRWLKLWDKVVFNRRPKIKPVKVEENNFKFRKQELSLKLDEHGRPEYKVALLCGPPGLGKTTLAHMVARHVGYNVIEVNASDDRSLDCFKKAIENSTSMRSVIDKENRPNCLVFDEIDGAPQPSIEFLVKFVNGTHAPKAKRGKNQKSSFLRRPIICICNDVYVPALRTLRQIAFVVNFPPTTSTRLAERLNEIARRQHIKTDMGALLALAEKAGNDIRACLSVLQFFKAKSKPTVTLSDVLNSSVGEKDMHKGLFTVWQEIFQIERPKQKLYTAGNETGSSEGVKCYADMSLKSRMGKILHTVNSFGDYERLMQGVFENYPSMAVKDSSMVGICNAMDWFCYNDLISTKLIMNQEYSLMTYLQYGFVMWHFVFASLSWQKITYPYVGYEVRAKATKLDGVVSELLTGVQPSVRSYIHTASLKLEILPYLMQIIAPTFRPVNQHLHTQQEKDLLGHVVSTMIDYNLNYVQERTPEGIYVYNLDPNAQDVVGFSNAKQNRALSYSNRQMIAREIEMEKMRRIEAHKNKGATLQKLKQAVSKDKLPNHLQRLQPKKIKPKETIIRKDFFGRIITKELNTDNGGGADMKNDIWYQYKEGYTNAVRKKIKVKALK